MGLIPCQRKVRIYDERPVIAEDGAILFNNVAASGGLADGMAMTVEDYNRRTDAYFEMKRWWDHVERRKRDMIIVTQTGRLVDTRHLTVFIRLTIYRESDG